MPPGLTQEQLAFEAQLDLTHVAGSKWEGEPSLLAMARLADVLSVSLPKLLVD